MNVKVPVLAYCGESVANQEMEYGGLVYFCVVGYVVFPFGPYVSIVGHLDGVLLTIIPDAASRQNRAIRLIHASYQGD
ncbi:hypothetical protein [Paeniglutamicibacter psychrophenolicus]|uniref:hypothetical protein n=1 Tax=Paeniglutamicibacter psychrophenolicus TaxID=257454 RepID=UPI0027831E2A|nr:hypothetical protein [Paeniglutamicibacter psychrophenolicus]MDQ0096135.1 hypothetical protein [Paeniglutamicibacter psychrophenolicus]